MQTVSAESIGSQEDALPNPVTGTKKTEYETGNVYVAGVLESILPVTPCLSAYGDISTIPSIFCEICIGDRQHIAIMVTSPAINLT